jgi:hypothetical protein
MLDVLDAASETGQDVAQLIGIRARADNTFLCAPQLRGGNSLHSLRELLGVLDGPNTSANIQEARHIRLRVPFRL